MSPAEQEETLDRARAALQMEFDEQRQKIEENHRAEVARVRAEFSNRLANWTRELSAVAVAEKSETASQAGGLALALAHRIIRDTVAVDPGFVVRTLETALYKIRETQNLTAVLHPEDADLLMGDPELMKQLRITQVISDRRIEKGGCLLRSDSKEWDATLSCQMETLTAIIEETLAIERTVKPSETGVDHGGEVE